MDLIVLSKNYPKKKSPHLGIFVKEQIQAMKNKIDGSITVISPVPWSPIFLWFRKKWREYGLIEKKKKDGGIQVYYPRYFVIPWRFFFPLQAFFMYLSARLLIKKLVKANKSRVVLHTHTVLPDGLAGVLLSNEFKIPHICTVHGSDINIYPFNNKLSLLLTKYTLNRCNYITTVSNKLMKKAKQIISDINAISVIYNGADNKKFKPITKGIAKQKLGIDGNYKIIMFIGNLLPIKGADYLIKAFSELLKEYNGDEVVLFMIGDGREKGKLIKISKSLKVENKVSFFGKRPHDEIPLWLNIADILVLPSISEGFPTIIPEAMMCGVPILASDVGGISEILIDGKTGLLFKPGDIKHIKEGLKFLLENENMRKKMSIAAKEQSRNYTWENNALRYQKVYQNIC